VRLTVQVKLCPSITQAASLLQTLECANDAANFISNWSWQHRTFHRYSVQKALYFRIKDQFLLPSQSILRVIAKVSDAYKVDRKRKRAFRTHGSIPYDSRILHWYQEHSQVSIITLSGRERIPYLCDERGRRMLLSQQGETDLVFRGNQFFLNTTIELPTPELHHVTQEDKDVVEGKGWLGVDMGITNIAVDSEGNVYSGAHVKSIRHRNRKLRAKLQSKGTRAAKRLLRKRKAKESRFARHTNHVISKRIVATAKALGKDIAVEELGGIRDRAPVRHSQRATLHSWSFYQLRSFIEYKAQLGGVRVCAVDPRNTSRECPLCGCIDKANRPTQSQFKCIRCGYAANADANAARNIASRAAHVSQPYLSRPLYPPKVYPQGYAQEEARARFQAKAVPL
jgi:IS605 OrfB family transposase